MFEHADDHRAELDAILAARAYIMGRNMFGPVRGEWTGDWRGWWGPEPPYHGPVFVLTNHPRETLDMDGGTTFTFVTDGIESAMAQAREAAGDGDISIAGGADTINQFLAAGHIDVLRLHIVPLTLGFGGSHRCRPPLRRRAAAAVRVDDGARDAARHARHLHAALRRVAVSMTG